MCVGLGMPESSVETDIGHVIATELVNEGDINDEVGVTTDVGALDEQIALSCLTILLGRQTDRDVNTCCTRQTETSILAVSTDWGSV